MATYDLGLAPMPDRPSGKQSKQILTEQGLEPVGWRDVATPHAQNMMEINLALGGDSRNQIVEDQIAYWKSVARQQNQANATAILWAQQSGATANIGGREFDFTQPAAGAGEGGYYDSQTGQWIPGPGGGGPPGGGTGDPYGGEWGGGVAPDFSSTFDAVTSMLTEAGLSDLIPWYRQKLTEGASAAEISILIQEQPAFKDRFKAIEERKGLGLPAISPQQVLDYERQARGLLRGAGLPEGFYDSPDDFKDLLVADVSLSQLAGRVQDGYGRVANASNALKSAFYDFYGINATDMLAAYFLDPEKAMPVLTQQIEAAGIAGVGQNFGIELNRERSEYFVQNSVNESMARQAFTNLQEVSSLFDETFYEGYSGEGDLRLEYEGLDAAFGLSGEAMDRIEARRRQRVAMFTGDSGGPGVTRAGFQFGTARG